jgi:hypothetical protein
MQSGSVELFGVRCQDDIQAFHSQAADGRTESHAHCTVPMLLNGHFQTVNDQGEQCVDLAQTEAGAETFQHTLVSGLCCGNLVC